MYKIISVRDTLMFIMLHNVLYDDEVMCTVIVG